MKEADQQQKNLSFWDSKRIVPYDVLVKDNC